MSSITFIQSTFYRCSLAMGRRSDCVAVIPSTWVVAFADGPSKKYNITLSTDILDPEYDSRREKIKKSKTFYIQIDDTPKFKDTRFFNMLSSSSFGRVMHDPKNYLVCPKNKVGRPLYFYVISPKEFNEIGESDYDNIFSNTDKINDVSNTAIFYNSFPQFSIQSTQSAEENPQTIDRIKKLDLNEFESKFLFHDLFEKYLIAFMQQKNPSTIDARKRESTELSTLLEHEEVSSSSFVKELFMSCFCCCNS